MSSQLETILQALNGAFSEQQILAYLAGTLPENEKQKLEVAFLENPFLEDAVEGLRYVTTPAEIPGIVRSLNMNLQNSLQKSKRKRTGVASQQWTIVAIVVVVLLCVVAYLVLHRLI